LILEKDTPESSNISRMSYDSDTAILSITFSNGSTYEYDEVPEEIGKEFFEADSIGKAFYAMIRGFYGFRQIVEEEG